MSGTSDIFPSTAGLTLAELNSLWGRRRETQFSGKASFYAGLARRALSLGEPLFACDVCSEALACDAIEDASRPELRKLHGLALARSGALESALIQAESLVREGHCDEESIGLLARIHKDLWVLAANPKNALEQLQLCKQLYVQAFQASGGYWSGINAATFSMIAGDQQEARRLAHEVQTLCFRERDPDRPEYWLDATLGECALVLGNINEARRWYRSAARESMDFGNLASTRRNATLLLNAQKLDASWLSDVLPSPAIMVFSGHMPDSPDRISPRFPVDAESALARRIRNLVSESDVRIGYGSAAGGSDILFHEAILDHGGEVHVVLPASPERFAAVSVTQRANWHDRFKRVLDKAASLTVLSESADGTLSYTYANWVLLGLARIRARQTGGQVQACVVWDGEPGETGGTASAIHDWRASGEQVSYLHPLHPQENTLPPFNDVALSSGAIEPGRRIITVLFADAVGFSKLVERQVPMFVEHFLGGVARLMGDLEEPPLTRNTWGDGLYFCFSSARSAGQFALAIAEMIAQTEWEHIGLPSDFNVRISLHTGPTYEVFDPVVGQRTFSGVHVNRGARIEPVTPPGQVYASQAFAALCECMRITDFTCDYVGQMPLAKGYGVYPVFHVRRAAVHVAQM